MADNKIAERWKRSQFTICKKFNPQNRTHPTLFFSQCRRLGGFSKFFYGKTGLNNEQVEHFVLDQWV